MKNLATNDLTGKSIVILSIYSPPELVGIAKYTGEMAEYLSENGARVKLVTSIPYYPQWKGWDGYKLYLYVSESMKGCDVTRCPIWIPKKLSGLKKMIHLALFGLTALPVTVWQLLVKKPDLIFIVYPYLFTAPYVLFIKKILFRKTKVWVHVQDFELDAAFDMGLIKNRFLKKVGYSIERYILQGADVTSSISNNMLKKLTDKGVADSKIAMFPNWIDVEKFKYIDRAENKMAVELGIEPAKSVVLYSGSIGEKQGLELIVEVASRKECENILFLIFGEGPNKEALVKSAQGLDNVRFHPLVAADRLNELLCLPDIHLLPQVSDAEDLVLPSKLLGMMLSGRPVVATANEGTQLHEILMDCGVVVAPGDVVGFSEELCGLICDESKMNNLGNKAKIVAHKLWEKNKVLSTFVDNARDVIAY